MSSIEILGTPLPKARPRFMRKGRFSKVYDCQSDEKKTISWLMKSKYIDPPLEGAVSVEMEFYFLKPKSVKRKHHTVKPDLDNICKMYKDCANGILWNDDKQIIELKATKQYGEIEKTVIHFLHVD